MVKRKRGRPPNPGSPPVDPATVDPEAALAGIVADLRAPCTCRVAAAKALLALRGRRLPSADSDARETLHAAALKLLKGGKK